LLISTLLGADMTTRNMLQLIEITSNDHFWTI